MTNTASPSSPASQSGGMTDQDHGISAKGVAVFGGGCFWCTEAVFLAVHGVRSVQSGYCGGHRDHPSYEEVCAGSTGHIEVVKIEFDPELVSYETLLEVFFATHDPTTPGRQGNDVGPQYQSAVFYQDESQRLATLQCINRLDDARQYASPICTKLLPAARFWPAEQYHNNYFARHPSQGYCAFVIAPKVAKFRESFNNLLRKD